MTTPPPGYGQPQQPYQPQPTQQPHQAAAHDAGYAPLPPAPAGYGTPAPYGAPTGYGQPAGAQAPAATIDLTVQGSVMMRSFIPPSITVNGHPLTSAYGRRPIPVPAGPVRVDVQCSWMRTYGQASLSFTAAPGQTIPVFYAAPAHQFTTGNIGHTPQKHKGFGLVWGILGAALVLGFAAVMLPALLS